jgi:uracil-DNA glycosylase family 4
MSPRAELLEIVSQLKNLLISYPQNGFDPSTGLKPLSPVVAKPAEEGTQRVRERGKQGRPSTFIDAGRRSKGSGSFPSTPSEEAQSGQGVEMPKASSQSVPEPDAVDLLPADLESLAAFIGDCKRCKLSQKRTHLVFGEGSPKARLVFVGEGPGADEDAAGRPFVGEAGKLLTRIIEGGMGLKREDVYICNVVKCRPPNNRDPEPDEVQTCLPFLKQQLAIIRPEVICTLGRIAVQTLLGREFKITQERGNWFSFMGTPIMATFHPAYILRNPSRERQLKGFVWEDVQKMMKQLGLKVRRDE